MIRIIIVEDNKETQMEIKKILRDMTIFKDAEIKIDYFTKFNRELESIIKDNTEPKIYIMDIELETKVSGIDIAKLIRNNDWDSEIIFLTNHDKMFETAYRSIYAVFNFIEKFHNMETRLKKDLKEIFKRKFDNKMLKLDNRISTLQIYYSYGFPC